MREIEVRNLLEEARDICGRFEMTGLLRDLGARLDVRFAPISDGIHFSVTFRTSDASDRGPNPGMSCAMASELIPFRVFETGKAESFMRYIVQTMFLGLFKHEMQEGLRFDGEFVTDPHPEMGKQKKAS